jgi:DNA-binding ferritin-like protein
MRVTIGTDCERSKEIAEGLSDLLSLTHTLRLQTRDLGRRLTGLTCSTLRLLLARQRDELRSAEAELAKRTMGAPGGTRRGARPVRARARPTNRRTMQRVDERVMGLVEQHEAASSLARSIGRRAKETGGLRTYDLLSRRADAHDEAALTLAPLILSSFVSCDLCEARSTCPLSAALLVKVETRVPKR